MGILSNGRAACASGLLSGPVVAKDNDLSAGLLLAMDASVLL
jgi:hypothetical protein